MSLFQKNICFLEKSKYHKLAIQKTTVTLQPTEFSATGSSQGELPVVGFPVANFPAANFPVADFPSAKPCDWDGTNTYFSRKHREKGKEVPEVEILFTVKEADMSCSSQEVVSSNLRWKKFSTALKRNELGAKGAEDQ